MLVFQIQFLLTENILLVLRVQASQLRDFRLVLLPQPDALLIKLDILRHPFHADGFWATWNFHHWRFHSVRFLALFAMLWCDFDWTPIHAKWKLKLREIAPILQYCVFWNVVILKIRNFNPMLRWCWRFRQKTSLGAWDWKNAIQSYPFYGKLFHHIQ